MPIVNSQSHLSIDTSHKLFRPEAEIAERWFAVWVEHHGLKRSGVHHVCPHSLVGKYCGRASDYIRAYQWCNENMPPFNDHESLWNRDGQPVVYVYHPYLSLTSENLAKIEQYAKETGLFARVTEHSWYFPGSTVQVELWRSEGDYRHKDHSSMLASHKE